MYIYVYIFLDDHICMYDTCIIIILSLTNYLCSRTLINAYVRRKSACFVCFSKQFVAFCFAIRNTAKSLSKYFGIKLVTK